ncbi:MAG TPA: replication-relaxation family protein [Polyangiaceae bacterium]|nr:replication-relaxation family protein [Polyangiaceae bacterium]
MNAHKVAKSRARRGVPQPTSLTRPGRKERRALLLTVWAGFLTTAQIAEAAGYSSLRRAQRRLRTLLDRGHLRVELQSCALHLPSLHVPTRRAIETLIEDGELPAGYRPPRLPRAQKRPHALLIRTVFIAFAAAETRGALRLTDFRFDSHLTREEPFHGIGLIPDAIATLALPDGSYATIAVEADAGTETTTTLRKKFAKWRAILDMWQPPRFTLLVVAEREGRRRTLARLMTEARIGDVGLAVVAAEVRGFVASLAEPHGPAARSDRAERRTRVLEPREVAGDRHVVGAAFRVIVR